jgi:hypothetical protein
VKGKRNGFNNSEADMTKLRDDQQEWFKRPRLSRLACVMYPHLTDQNTRDQMAALAKNEGKRPPQSPNLLPYVGWDEKLRRK